MSKDNIHYVAVSSEECLIFDNWLDAHNHFNDHMSRPCGVFEAKHKTVQALNLNADCFAIDEETGYTETQVLDLQLAENGYTTIRY